MAKGDKPLLFFLSLFALGLFCEGEALAAEPAGSSSKIVNVDHGDAQVVKLVSDLPQLQTIVQKDNPIWNWLKDAFNYSANGIKIFWDSGPTVKTNTFSNAETRTDQSTGWCFIRADRFYKDGQFAGAEIRAEEVLASLVLELNNAKQHDETADIWRRAYEGRLTKNEFVLANAEIEFLSEKGVKAFLEDTWLPFCKDHHMESDHQIWFACQSDTFPIWIKHYPPDSEYPWKIYGDQYDEIIKK